MGGVNCLPPRDCMDPMKKLLFYLLLPVSLFAKEDGDFTIDEIKAVVEGPMRLASVAASDIKRRGFDGVGHDVKDVVLEIVKDQHGEELGISITDEDVDKYLRAMSEGTEVSKESLIAMAKDFGYDTVAEFYTDLKRLYRANTTMDQEIRSYLAISEQEAKAYYDKHPEYKEGVYYLQTAHIRFRDDMSKHELKRALEHPETSTKIGKTGWGVPFDVAYSELADDKQFIKKMKIGEVYALEVADGFDLYRLKNNIKPALVSFAERRKAIIDKLRAEKFDKLFGQYNDSIMKEVSVTYY